jgi:hypothetical protein
LSNAVALPAPWVHPYGLLSPLARWNDSHSTPSAHHGVSLHLPLLQPVWPNSDCIYFAENYLQNQLNDPARPGALGLGQSTATNISNAYLLFAAIAPTPFAILSDTKLGRFKTLAVALS